MDKGDDAIEGKRNMSTSPAREGSANAGSSNGNLDEKPRLSENEKKANHIASGELALLDWLTGRQELVVWFLKAWADRCYRTETETGYSGGV